MEARRSRGRRQAVGEHGKRAKGRTIVLEQSAKIPRSVGAPFVRCLFVVFLCFTFTSASYLSWVYRLAEFMTSESVDALSMIAGYLLQALGIGMLMALVRYKPQFQTRTVAIGATVLYSLCFVPTVIGTSIVGVIAFGLLMNLFCGVIAGLYLLLISEDAPANRRGITFGGGYALATIAVWLLSLADGANFLHSGAAIIAYLALAAVAIVVFARYPSSTALGISEDISAEFKNPSGSSDLSGMRTQDTPGDSNVKSLLILAAAAIFFLSLVKNLGFGFPLADVQGGINLELSRVFYALGLVVAGVLNDRSRKYGAICCLVALIVPFIMLALAGEPVSSMVFWCLDYLFFGFFSVFRAVLFCDLAADKNLPWIAGFGLLFGRVGDALGTGIFMLVNSPVVLVVLAAALFAVSVVLFLRLYQHLFSPAQIALADKSQSELFEDFSARFDLTVREREVLRLLLSECTNSEIAGQLFISESTVKFHVRNLLKKTGCKNRLELITLFYA